MYWWRVEDLNVVECYIKEVHSVEEVVCDWGTFVKVDLTYDCYGITERRKTSFLIEEWKEALEEGYYLA